MLSLELIIILMLLMFLVSFLYSNIGLGGGTLYVPIMVFLAVSLQRLEIIPISLFLSLMTQLPAAYTHFKKNYVKIKLGVLLGCATFPGVIIGVLLGIRTQDSLAYGSFSILLFITAIKMFYDLYKKKFDEELPDREYSIKQVALVCVLSICTGMVSSFFGVGGGIVTVPLLIYILGIYPRRAIGTSAFMIVLTSFVGVLCYYFLSLGSVEIFDLALRSVPTFQIELALILGAIVFVGAYLGSSWGLKSLKTKRARHLLSM